jgi:GxxExxY protein
MTENELSRIIFDSGLKVHKALGPGLLESTYEVCLAHELMQLNIHVERQVSLPVKYNNIQLDAGYRIDLLVENKVIVEIKAVKDFEDIYLAQLLTYLKLSGCKLGLLVNFNKLLFKDGVRRVINGNLQ